MLLPGAIQVRVKSPRGGCDEAIVSSWTLPIYGVMVRSPSVMMLTGDDLVQVSQRVAETLGIRDGEEVDFDLVDVGDTIRLPVKIMRGGYKSDIVIHDWLTLGLLERYIMDSRDGDQIILKSGKTLHLKDQAMWAGMTTIQFKGTVCLHFDGASRNNPKGPTGYGFRITDGEDSNGAELIRGYGYGGMERTSNEMEYCGLIEGIIWALRMNSKHVKICGDSQLILRQMSGRYQVNNPKLKILQGQAQKLLNEANNRTVTYQHVPREENRMVDLLANIGIDSRENCTWCNWDNVNRFYERN